MNRLFFALIAFIVAAKVAEAHPVALPTLDWLHRSDAVYLVRTGSVKELNDGFKTQTVVFATLKGESISTLTLTAVEGYRSKPKDEFILIHNPGGFKDDVGWTIEGDPEWWPLPVTDKDGNDEVEFLGPLADVREYLRTHPSKPN
jgi:hypothetical protein